VLTDPDKNLAKAEFMPGYRAVDESVSIYPFHFDIETVASQEDIIGSKGDALVAVDEATVVGEDEIRLLPQHPGGGHNIGRQTTRSVYVAFGRLRPP
jgi:hypothetical protein